MIWVVLYCVIGLVVTLQAPIQRARLLKEIDETKLCPDRVAAMTDNEKALFAASMRAARVRLSTWQLVINGLLWPLQVLIMGIAHVWIFFFRRRVGKR
jgi:hypothetical protein